MLRVPTDDLNDFHARHFSSVPTNSFSNTLLSATSTAGEVVDAPISEDGNLGFYADGVERTLTHQQVAMFRHSEVQALIREERWRKEREHSVEDQPPVRDESSKDILNDEESDTYVGDDLDEDEYLAFLQKEKDDLLDVKATRIPNVREEDIQDSEMTPLDYDDEPIKATDSPEETAALDQIQGRKKIFYGDTEEFESPSFNDFPGSLPRASKAKLQVEETTKGKAFLWPKIG
ncbi:MAG: hypothetical protein M4579_003245 [Chaenotheca gracillima]|nr:MAG: hypothetical protein M4579_003245 [Chaenotheca gracillima]